MQRRKHELVVRHALSFEDVDSGTIRAERDFIADDFTDHGVVISAHPKKIEQFDCPHCKKTITEGVLYYEVYFIHDRSDNDVGPCYEIKDNHDMDELKTIAASNDPEAVFDWLIAKSGSDPTVCDPFDDEEKWGHHILKRIENADEDSHFKFMQSQFPDDVKHMGWLDKSCRKVIYTYKDSVKDIVEEAIRYNAKEE